MTVMNQAKLSGFEQARLIEQVQRNCHIADANHGADYTLCIYLMKMREYYRWEQGRAFGAHLDKDEVGDWLVKREADWQELDGQAFSPIELAGKLCDPFEADSINRHLRDTGLVYGGGLGHTGRPHFFLAEIRQTEQQDDWTLWVSGREWARDLTAPPAMSQGRTIVIRRESLKRMLWERLENWRWSAADNAMGRALACYDFEGDLENALEQMTEAETAAVLWHEMGEVRAGKLLGPGWEPMLEALLFTPAELACRAVRDHLADCLETLPRLIEQAEPASIHFFIGNLSAMRRSLFPSLDLAYQSWQSQGDWSGLQRLARQGRDHWLCLAEQILQLHQEQGEKSAKPIAQWVEAHRL